MQILVYYPSANFHYCSSGNTNHEVALTRLPSESLHKPRRANDMDEMRNLVFQKHLPDTLLHINMQ